MYCLSPPMSEPPEGMQENFYGQSSDLSYALPAGAVTAARHQVVFKRLLIGAFTTIGTFLTLLNNSFSSIKYAEAQLIGLNIQTFI